MSVRVGAVCSSESAHPQADRGAPAQAAAAHDRRRPDARLARFLRLPLSQPLQGMQPVAATDAGATEQDQALVEQVVAPQPKERVGLSRPDADHDQLGQAVGRQPDLRARETGVGSAAISFLLPPRAFGPPGHGPARRHQDGVPGPP